MRALLVLNPSATNVSRRVRDVIAAALAAEVKIDVVETKRRGHATHIAAGAAHEGVELIVCLSGDGTLNEVVNGVAGTGVAVAPLPGGGTNVFARTLGLPRDPVEATGVILERIRERVPPRPYTLGTLNGRHFAFCAGIGLDAAVVRAVERRVRFRKRLGDWLFVSTALREFFLSWDRSEALLRIRAGGEDLGEAHLAIACKSDPYTYLGARPFRLLPEATAPEGLDVLALRSLRTVGTLRVVLRAFGKARHTRMRHVLARHDVASIEIDARRPVPYQLDGDYLGEATRFELGLAPAALCVLA